MVDPRPTAARNSALITFLSDFGLTDEWVGVCHAVMLELDPGLRIVDLCHGVPPFDIRKGAFLLASALPTLQPAVHLAVIDPGVGTGRRLLCLQTNRGDIMVGPDNGLLIPGAERLGGVLRVFSIENSSLFRHPVSRTFHARDIMAPVAAALAGGADLTIVGPEIEEAELVPSPWQPGNVTQDQAWAEVIEIDAFGSVHVAVEERAASGAGLALEAGITHLRIESKTGTHYALAATTYADVDEGALACIWDSTGFLTVAGNKSFAHDLLGVRAGDTLRITLEEAAS